MVYACTFYGTNLYEFMANKIGQLISSQSFQWHCNVGHLKHLAVFFFLITFSSLYLLWLLIPVICFLQQIFWQDVKPQKCILNRMKCTVRIGQIHNNFLSCMDECKVRLGKELLKRNCSKYCFIKITMKLLIWFIYSLLFKKGRWQLIFGMQCNAQKWERKHKTSSTKWKKIKATVDSNIN